MRKTIDAVMLDQYMGCFGDFDDQSNICRSQCAVNLRCTIESEQNARMELLEDLMDTDFQQMIIQ